MKMSFIALLGFLVAAAWAQQPVPRLNTVEPPNGKAGDTLTAAGENLGKPTVVKLYLTDGKNDVEVEVTEQTDTDNQHSKCWREPRPAVLA